MGELIGRMITNPDVLTPQGIYEIFGMFMLMELIGYILSWTKGGVLTK